MRLDRDSSFWFSKRTCSSILGYDLEVHCTWQWRGVDIGRRQQLAVGSQSSAPQNLQRQVCDLDIVCLLSFAETTVTLALLAPLNAFYTEP